MAPLFTTLRASGLVHSAWRPRQWAHHHCCNSAWQTKDRPSPTCPLAGASRKATALPCGRAPCDLRSSRVGATSSAPPPPAAAAPPTSGAHTRTAPRDEPVHRPPHAVLAMAVTAPARNACQRITRRAAGAPCGWWASASALTRPPAWPSHSRSLSGSQNTHVTALASGTSTCAGGLQCQVTHLSSTGRNGQQHAA
jgi:hypothetical protein